MTDGLKKKVDFAIKLLRSIPTEDGPIEISFSGGEAKESESDLRISVAKLRDILEDVASSQFMPRVLDDDTVDEIINQVKKSI